MDRMLQKQPAGIRKLKASNPSIRPLNLPKLAKNTSRLIDIERQLQAVRERLVPLLQPDGSNKNEYSPAPYRPKRRKRKSCNTQFVQQQSKQRERFHTSQLHDEQSPYDEPAKADCDSHFTNIDITIKEIKLRAAKQLMPKNIPTESTGADQTLSSFERLINKNRDLIRIARHQKKIHEYSSRVSRVRNSIHQASTDKDVTPVKHKEKPKEKLIAKNESALFENINSMLKLRQKTENLRDSVPSNKSSIIGSKRYNSQQRTAKNITCQPEITFEQQPNLSRQELRADEQQEEDGNRWRRISLNTRNELEMVQSSFHQEVDKISQYESKTKDYMGKYVKNLQTLMVLQLNQELRRRSLKVTERRPTQ